MTVVLTFHKSSNIIHVSSQCCILMLCLELFLLTSSLALTHVAKVLAHCLKEIHCAVNLLGSAAQCPLCLNVHNLLQF